MVVNNAILKIIVRECCHSLSYDDEEQQFSFTLNPAQDKIWNRIKDQLQTLSPQFYLDDFNNILSNLKNAENRYHLIAFTALSDSEIMNGEVIAFQVDSAKVIALVKMQAEGYLDVNSGEIIHLGTTCQFKNGCNIEGEERNLGMCKSISLRIPTKEHIALSWRFIDKYYRRRISSSLWPIYEEACGICSAGRTTKCQNLLDMAKENGINSFTLLNILKGASAICKH